MTKKVFKYSEENCVFVEVGLLTNTDEVVFHKPLRDRITHVGLYHPEFYTKDDDGEYHWLGVDNKLAEDRASEKEITTSVDGLNCSLGYIDHNDSIVFYDQYL